MNTEVKILFVEDNEWNAKYAINIIRKMKMEYCWVTNGDEAIEEFCNGNYNIILMDIQIPGKDGIMVAKKIRELKKEREEKIYIIAYTAYGREEELKAFFENGFDEVLTKPVLPDVLKENLEKFRIKLKIPEKDEYGILEFMMSLDYDRDVFRDICVTFFETIKDYLEKLKLSFETKNMESIKMDIQKIKSTLNTVRCKKLINILSRIESCTKNLESVNEKIFSEEIMEFEANMDEYKKKIEQFF